MLLLLILLLPATGLRAARDGYLDLRELSSDLGLSYSPGSGETPVRIEGEWVTLDFTASSRILFLNGVKVFLGDPVLHHRGSFYIASDEWRLAVRPILMPRTVPSPPGFRRVALDAGHGGADPGGRNPSAGLDEKDLTLEMVRLIGSRLREKGFEVIHTRTDDRFLPLTARPGVAARAGADLFLSIHFNAARPDVRGVETFVYPLQGDASSGRGQATAEDRLVRPANANDPWNALLGYYLQRDLLAGSGLPDRGLKRARFAVLEPLDCPGALLELGFVTNPSTAALVKDPAFRERLAEAVVEGVLRYRRTLVRITGGNAASRELNR